MTSSSLTNLSGAIELVSSPYELAPSVRKALEDLATNSDMRASLRNRAQIILALAQGISVTETANRLDILPSTVIRCRCNWLIRNAVINKVLLYVSSDRLSEVLNLMLSNSGKTYHLRVIAEFELAQLLQIYATGPQAFGYESWSPNRLVDVVQEQQISQEVSVADIRVLYRALARWEKRLLS